MVTRNIDIQAGVVNGMMGTVVSVLPRSSAVIVSRVKPGPGGRTDQVAVLRTSSWINVEGYGYVKRTHVPLVLCNAATVHKFQGQEVLKAVVPIDHMDDQNGQLYVTLSRCKDPDFLVLTARSADVEMSVEGIRECLKVDQPARQLLEKWSSSMQDYPLPPAGYCPLQSLTDKVVSAVSPVWCNCSNCYVNLKKRCAVVGLSIQTPVFVCFKS